MTCGNTSDFIDHPLPKHFVSAHGASHHAWAPGSPPSKSGADANELPVAVSAFENTKKLLCLHKKLIEQIFVEFTLGIFILK